MKSMKVIYGAILFALMGLFVSVGPRPAYAADVEVTLATTPVTGTPAEFTAAGYPQIANGAFMRSIVFANYDGAATQIVELYRNATSTTAATLEMTYVVPSSTTISIPFPERAYNLRNVAIKKSSTGSTIKAQVVYE